jgi:hypothetical protein
VRLTHALIVTLVLMVSPLAATVCEVVCGLPSTATADAAVVTTGIDEHAHHAHHAPPPPAPSTDPASPSLSAPDCELTQANPARVRTAFADSTNSVAAFTTQTLPVGASPERGRVVLASASSPPAPHPHAPVPLRI